MGVIPIWVWTSTAMFLAGGVYLWWRLVAGTTRPGSTGRRIGTAVVVVLTVLGPGALVAQFTLPMSVQRVIGWPGWLAYALLVFLIFATLLTEPVRIVLWFRRRSSRRADGSGVPEPGDGPASPDRRLLLQRGLAIGIGVASVAAAAVAAPIAVGGPVVRTATIRVRGLPRAAAGMRLALVSDLHLGSILGRDFCRSVVDLVNAQQPDIVLLIGDLTDGTVEELAEELRPLADLRSAEGSFFVTGNHEFYFDPDGWQAFLPQLGVTTLGNESRTVRGLLLAGIHDITGEPIGRGPDLDAALAARASGQPVVLMSHSPVPVHDAAARGVDVMVCGHTHGGQFYPFKWIVAATNPAVSGLHRFGETQLFITNGAGFWGPIARLGADPDISILTLEAE